MEAVKEEKNTKRDEMGIFGTFPSEMNSAIKYYRIAIPLRGLDRMEGCHTYLAEPQGETDLRYEALMGADISIYWRVCNKEGYEYFKQFSDFEPIEKDGKITYPPLLIMDTDDAVDWIHPFNMAYNCLGVRDQEGNLLKPGQNVMVNYKGEDQVLWRDKFTRGQKDYIFDIGRNLRDIGYHYDAARCAAGVTVTNNFLAQIYKDQGCEEVYVFPNTIDPDDWWFPPLRERTDGKIRIIWEGGSSHLDSWIPIRQPIVDVLKNNPQAKLVIFGDPFDWMKKEIAADQLELHHWIGYDGYKLKRACLDADINLAPLTASAFTESKSAIRWYEASMGPRPEATLAADVGPYQEIEDGKTGLLYKTPQEFAEKLQSLIDNADLRKRLGEGAQEWVLANRTMRQTIPGLHKFYKHLLAKQRRDFLAK